MTSTGLGWFLFVNAVSGVGVGAGRVLGSLYSIDLQASPSLMGLIAGAQSLGLLLMALPAGAMVERWGPKRLFIVGSLAAAGAYAMTPLWRDAVWLAIATALLNLCLPARFVAMNAGFLARLSTWGEHKAGWLRGTHLAGLMLIGPSAAASLFDACGVVVTYLVVAGLALVSAVLAPRAFGGDEALRTTPATRRSLTWPLTLLVTDPALRLACVRELVGQMAQGFFAFFMLVIAVRQFGASPPQAALLVTIQGAAFVVSLFAAGRVAAALGGEVAARAGLVLCAAAMAVLGLAPTTAVAAAGAALFGLALGLVHVANIGLMAKAGLRHGQAPVTTLSALAGPTGGLAGGLLGGWFGAGLGLQPVFLLLLPVFLLVVLLPPEAPTRAERDAKPGSSSDQLPQEPL